MKKLLLIATAFLGAVSVMAETDGATYESVNGFTIQNKWIYAKNINRDAYVDLVDVCNQASPNACIYNDYAIVASSQDAEGHLCIFDLETGEYLKTLALTRDGEQYEGTLCANTIGVDDYGHLYVGRYTDPTSEVSLRAYTVDIETGVLTLVGEMMLGADEAEASGRMDYFDVLGDITGEQDGAIIMCSVEADLGWAYRWKRAQGGDWTPDFDGYVSLPLQEYFPIDLLSFGNCVYTKIIDEDYYYIDGSWNYATLYNTDGSAVESVADAPEELVPTTGVAGICEFTLGGKDFVAYPIMQPNDDISAIEYLSDADRATVYICEFGDGKSFEGMTKYWRVPESIDVDVDGTMYPRAGLGDETDSGRRLQIVDVKVVTDANGKEGAYIFTHKCYNGLGVYFMAEEGFDDGGSSKVESIDADIAAATISVVGKVITVSAEASDIAVYNLAGQKIAEVKNATQIAAPACGAYIVKAIVDGAAVVAKVII